MIAPICIWGEIPMADGELNVVTFFPNAMEKNPAEKWLL
jgi:hypothetical protein